MTFKSILTFMLNFMKKSLQLELFDRGYPSKDFISFIENKKIKYLMRVSKVFKSIVNVKNEDQIIEIKYVRTH